MTVYQRTPAWTVQDASLMGQSLGEGLGVFNPMRKLLQDAEREKTKQMLANLLYESVSTGGTPNEKLFQRAGVPLGPAVGTTYESVPGGLEPGIKQAILGDISGTTTFQNQAAKDYLSRIAGQPTPEPIFSQRPLQVPIPIEKRVRLPLPYQQASPE